MTLPDLIAAAQAATPGPWHVRTYRRGVSWWVCDSEDRYLFRVQRVVEPNADFVAAAHPAVVIALCRLAMATWQVPHVCSRDHGEPCALCTATDALSVALRKERE
jgi:hypothetical protein